MLSACCVCATSYAHDKDGFEFEIGAGLHSESLDGPEYTTKNPLGIVAVKYNIDSWVVGLEHASSLQGFPDVFNSKDEHGYGANTLSVRYRWRP